MRDPIISVQPDGAALVQLVAGKAVRADDLCPHCLNPALFDVNVYGYGNDPTKAQLLVCQRLCVDCERPV